jgi:mannose-6-phosphate isomerase
MRPLRFIPFIRRTVWGGQALAEQLGKPLPDDGAYGESWEVSDHRLHRSVVAAGPHQGQTLRWLMERHAPDVLGAPVPADTSFPWLVKFLDCHDWLSVQVHPDERAVTELWPGEGSKTEAWFVLDATPGGKIYAGLRPGVDEAVLRRALTAGTVADCLHAFTPQVGDCVFLPAGTVHAVGGGVLMAEVQQTSDATFRLFDWNRRDATGQLRPLHVEESLRAIHWDQGPVAPVRVENLYAASGPARRQTLVECPYFGLDYVEETARFNLPGQRLHAIIVVHGSGRLYAGGAQETIAPGQVWLLPAALTVAEMEPQPRVGLLVSRLP